MIKYVIAVILIGTMVFALTAIALLMSEQAFNTNIPFINQRNVKVGEKYTFSFEYNRMKDPFKNVHVDTITILDIKNNYVKWKYSNGFITSDNLWWINNTSCVLKLLP